jgi:hypothetical protein
MSSIMRLDNQLMGIVIDVDLIGVHGNIGVAEEFRHLFERDALGFRKEEINEENPEAGDDDEDKVELPADGCEGLRRLAVLWSHWGRKKDIRWRRLGGRQDLSVR